MYSSEWTRPLSKEHIQFRAIFSSLALTNETWNNLRDVVETVSIHIWLPRSYVN